jgi:lipopolysaccharide assembly outer membrane protein LptD (OstA)
MNKHKRTFLKNSTIIAVIVILAGMSLPSVCHPQESERFLNKVIRNDSFKVMHADNIIRNKRHQQFTFTGNVAMYMLRDTVTCDSAIFNYKKSTVIVYGHIKSRGYLRVKIQIPGFNNDGQTYFLKTGHIMCAGPAY